MLDLHVYLDDLEGYLVAEAASKVGGVARVPAAMRERAADLFCDDALRAALAGLRSDDPALATLVFEAAISWRLADPIDDAQRPANEARPCGPDGPATWAEAGYWLSSVAEAARRRSVRTGLERVGERVAGAEDELTGERAALAADLGLGSEPEAWERSRGRTWASVAGIATHLLERTAAHFGARLHGVASAEERRHWSWVDMPWVLRSMPGADGLPPLQGQLLGAAAAELQQGRLLEERLHIEIGPASAPAAQLRIVEPGGRIHAALRPMGGAARDYRVALRLLGRGLALAAIEDVSGVRARAIDPAVPACFGALFESLVASEPWRRRLIRQAVPAAVASAFALQCRLRLRYLAAETVSCVGTGRAPVPGKLVALAQAGDGAVGFAHPSVPVPWAHRGGEAADELVGWVLAAEIEDRLATRFGRDWSRFSAAGRWLRDLWAAAPRTANSLAADVGIRGLGDVELLIERWFAGTER